ncbi:MAG: DUF2934 domain-containing protein [Bryobacteraceae bacterium]|nr:DUF2934 domain-containing protein [Bryobacteraceae bacterium]
MATRKKTSPDSETVRADEFAAASQKLTRARKSATTDASATAEKMTRSKSPAAATHKAPARKSVPAAPAAEPAVEAFVAETVAFDISLYHEEISKEAYYTWLRNGCPQSTEHHDWLAAIEVVRARHQK